MAINSKLHIREAAWILDNSGADFAFVSQDIAKGLEDLMDERACALIFVEQSAFSQMKEGQGLEAPVSLTADDMAWLFYTSGTTGTPKGVMISCGNLSGRWSYGKILKTELRKWLVDEV
ncbi:MAG: long-chain fatty acid--CoA ligase [Cohaesibacter sp.]|nr:long-chain fatty acid--CoA ligase [Cohaesibacter sp.]